LIKFKKHWGLNNNLKHLEWTEGVEQWINKECDVGSCHDTFLKKQKDGKDLNAEVAENFLSQM